MHENIEKKINFIKIVLVSISKNRDMVLKWKLSQLVWTDLFPPKNGNFFDVFMHFELPDMSLVLSTY